MFSGVKLDKDLSTLVAKPLIDTGYAVASVLSQGWGGVTDEVLFPLVQQESRMLITAGKGFGDIRRYPPGSHAGIVVLRPARESILDYAQLVEMLLAQQRLEDLIGCLVIVTPHRIRIRR